MTIPLIQGEFSYNDAMDLITQMIHIKIKYHKNKIAGTENEEEVKSLEAKIIQFQKELFEARNKIKAKKGAIKINSIINIE